MSYTPTSWTTGDTITASALNKIEQGIANAGGGGGGTEISYTMENDLMVLDASYNDIKQILLSGSIPYILFTYESEEFDMVNRYSIVSVVYDENMEECPVQYNAFCIGYDLGMGVYSFGASTATGNLTQYYGN